MMKFSNLYNAGAGVRGAEATNSAEHALALQDNNVHHPLLPLLRLLRRSLPGLPAV
jgi:hypothetical protein